MDPISILLFTLFVSYSVYMWKTYDHPRFSWALIPVAIITVTAMYQWFSDSLSLSAESVAMEFYIVSAIQIISFIVFGYILFKK